MNFNQADKIVRQMSYKPGTIIEFLENDYSPTLLIRSKEPNVHGEGEIDLSFQQVLYYEHMDMMDEAAFVAWVYDMFQRKETHELQEWLKIKGVCVREPVH